MPAKSDDILALNLELAGLERDYAAAKAALVNATTVEQMTKAKVSKAAERLKQALTDARGRA